MDKIFILGNGPSLNGQRELMPEVGKHPTFCCTRAYLWEGLCFTPTYYACNFSLVVDDHLEPEKPPNKKGKFIISINGETLQGWKRYIKSGDTPLAMKGRLVRSGGTMPYITAQIAVRLGYRDLYFLGIEQNGQGHCFDPEGNHHPFIAPTEIKRIERWTQLKEFYESHGVRLHDCTPSGKLNNILGYTQLENALEN